MSQCRVMHKSLKCARVHCLNRSWTSFLLLARYSNDVYEQMHNKQRNQMRNYGRPMHNDVRECCLVVVSVVLVNMPAMLLLDSKHFWIFAGETRQGWFELVMRQCFLLPVQYNLHPEPLVCFCLSVSVCLSVSFYLCLRLNLLLWYIIIFIDTYRLCSSIRNSQ